ncbi:unnamed protein product [Ectocarpus sp. 12 AP-2014]
MEEWEDGGEEEDEFAYVHYAQTAKRRRLQQQVEEGGGAAATGDAPQQNQQQQQQEDSSSTDAFRGHHCPICLGLVEDSAMIESCRHLYCKVCLFEWLKASDRCPLCKVTVSQVLHEIKSPKDYEIHTHISVKKRGGGDVEGSLPSPPAAGGTAAETSGRSGGGDECAGASGGSAVIDGKKGPEFRSLVYRRGLAAEPPEEKARRPKPLDQLRSWIARDVQAAAPGSRGEGGMDTRLVEDIVRALLKDNDVDTQDGYCTVKEQLQGFLFENTAPFLHELWCFRWSKARMPAYDREAVYRPRPTQG